MGEKKIEARTIRESHNSPTYRQPLPLFKASGSNQVCAHLHNFWRLFGNLPVWFKFLLIICAVTPQMHSASESSSAWPIVCRVLQHTSKLAQAGPVWLPLFTERSCKAEIWWTVTGRPSQSKHLPAPGNPALDHLQKQKNDPSGPGQYGETRLYWGLFTFLTGARLELVTISLVRFRILSSCSLWSWSFSCSSWERTSFSVAVVWVTEETWKWTHRTCDHMTLSIMSHDWRKQAGITILTSWSRRLRSTISFR